ncbi:hypothetical protein ACROYT_G040139 [Oculina patagonica]
MWKVHPDIRIEGPLLTCESDNRGARCLKQFSAEFPHFEMWNIESALLTCDVQGHHGARCLTQFSAEFPHFEVVILETGKKRCLGIGVVNEDYNTIRMPGWDKESVGYHTDDGKIYHYNARDGKETKGPVMARRGDQIRCRVIFENEKEINGKRQVPVTFSLNGREIITEEGEDQFFLDFDKPLYPYIGMTDGCSVLAKMLRDDKQALSTTSTSQGSDPGVLSVGPKVIETES